MTYLSLEFFVLFVLFYGVYWALACCPRWQNGVLLLASYALVAAFTIDSALILLGYSIAVQCLAQWLHRHPQSRKGSWLIGLLLFGVLAFFKYTAWLGDLLMGVTRHIGLSLEIPTLSLIVPIGVSFYVFHSASYLIAVHKQEMRPLPSFDLFVYLAFFPSVVAGPINRVHAFVAQIQSTQIRQVIDWRQALWLISLAIGKLLLLSAWLAENFANPVFNSPSLYTPAQTLLGVYAYSVQIYCNFSGYTDLVTALAMLLGFRLPQNFNSPYLAQNLSEFWQRWHISLSRFIRDYVYIPLGGNRYGFTRTQINLTVAMLLSGIWHGAGLNFLLWGALHAFGLVFCHVVQRFFPGVGTLLRRCHLARFLCFHYICFTWIFFRSANFADTLTLLDSLASLSIPMVMESTSLLACLLLIMVYPWLLASARALLQGLQATPAWAYPILLGLFVHVLILLSPPGVPEFIYARF